VTSLHEASMIHLKETKNKIYTVSPGVNFVCVCTVEPGKTVDQYTVLDLGNTVPNTYIELLQLPAHGVSMEVQGSHSTTQWQTIRSVNETSDPTGFLVSNYRYLRLVQPPAVAYSIWKLGITTTDSPPPLGSTRDVQDILEITAVHSGVVYRSTSSTLRLQHQVDVQLGDSSSMVVLDTGTAVGTRTLQVGSMAIKPMSNRPLGKYEFSSTTVRSVRASTEDRAVGFETSTTGDMVTRIWEKNQTTNPVELYSDSKMIDFGNYTSSGKYHLSGSYVHSSYNNMRFMVLLQLRTYGFSIASRFGYLQTPFTRLEPNGDLLIVDPTENGKVSIYRDTDLILQQSGSALDTGLGWLYASGDTSCLIGSRSGEVHLYRQFMDKRIAFTVANPVFQAILLSKSGEYCVVACIEPSGVKLVGYTENDTGWVVIAERMLSSDKDLVTLAWVGDQTQFVCAYYSEIAQTETISENMSQYRTVVELVDSNSLHVNRTLVGACTTSESDHLLCRNQLELRRWNTEFQVTSGLYGQWYTPTAQNRSTVTNVFVDQIEDGWLFFNYGTGVVHTGNADFYEKSFVYCATTTIRTNEPSMVLYGIKISVMHNGYMFWLWNNLDITITVQDSVLGERTLVLPLETLSSDNVPSISDGTYSPGEKTFTFYFEAVATPYVRVKYYKYNHHITSITGVESSLWKYGTFRVDQIFVQGDYTSEEKKTEWVPPTFDLSVSGTDWVAVSDKVGKYTYLWNLNRAEATNDLLPGKTLRGNTHVLTSDLFTAKTVVYDNGPIDYRGMDENFLVRRYTQPEIVHEEPVFNITYTDIDGDTVPYPTDKFPTNPTDNTHDPHIILYDYLQLHVSNDGVEWVLPGDDGLPGLYKPTKFGHRGVLVDTGSAQYGNIFPPDSQNLSLTVQDSRFMKLTWVQNSAYPSTWGVLLSSPLTADTVEVDPGQVLVVGDEAYIDPGVYLVNNGVKIKLSLVSTTVDTTEIGNYKATYLLPSGETRDIDVPVEGNQLDSLFEADDSTQVDTVVLEQFQKRGKSALYRNMKQTLGSKPGRKKTIRREYLQHILPNHVKWVTVEIHYPQPESVVRLPEDAIGDTGLLILTTLDQPVKIEVDRYRPFDMDTYTGLPGQIVKTVEGGYLTNTPTGWVTTDQEAYEPQDTIQVKQVSEGSYEISPVNGAPRIVQSSQTPITSTTVLGEGTQVYVNNTGFILGSILQTEGYTPQTLSSSIIGDPYIRTIQGMLYKLPNQHRCYRLIQTEDLIVNTTVTPLGTTHQERRQRYIRKYNINGVGKNTEYFIHELFFQFRGNYSMIYNVITGKFDGPLMDHPNVRLTKSNSKKMFRCAVQGSSWYTSKKLIIQSGSRDYHFEFREFEHPQLVCGLKVRLKNKQKLPVTAAGVLLGNPYRKCVVSSLKCSSLLKPGKEMNHSRPITEHWSIIPVSPAHH
jgi:hypothetical protein